MTNHTSHAGGVTIHDRQPALSPGTSRALMDVSPYVIVPGIGMTHRYSERLHRALGENRSAFSLDIPGFGDERKPRRQLPVAEYARIIGRALDDRSLSGVVLIGHSMGAQFAAEIAATRPDLVSDLVLASPVVDPDRGTAHQQILDMARNLLAEAPTATATVIADFFRTGPRFFFAEMRSMLAYDTAASVRAVACPVLIVRGEHDPIARRAWCLNLASSVAGGMVEILGARHLVQHTEPVAMTRAIAAFATRAETGR